VTNKHRLKQIQCDDAGSQNGAKMGINLTNDGDEWMMAARERIE
jgi:hypothetical protein